MLSPYLCCLCNLLFQVCHFILQSLILHYNMNRLRILQQWYLVVFVSSDCSSSKTIISSNGGLCVSYLASLW